MEKNEIIPGAFAQFHQQYFKEGLAVLPTGGEDGKQALRYGYNKQPYAPDTLAKFAADLPGANIGIIPAFSKLAVVDVDSDDLSVQQGAIDRFGDTDIKIRTGRGGLHLYYSCNRPFMGRNLRRDECLPIELKSLNEYVVAPPSRNPKTGGYYGFIEGGLGSFGKLPGINLSTIADPYPDKRTARGKLIAEGQRNTWLFEHLMHEVTGCDDIEALLDVAYTRADEFFEVTMSAIEIERTARSVWRYETEGRNWIGYSREAQVIKGKTEIRDFARGSMKATTAALAYRLLDLFRVEHSARYKEGGVFCITPRAMVEADVLPGWTIYNYRDARDALLELGEIVRVRKGGIKGCPSLYRLASKKGSKI